MRLADAGYQLMDNDPRAFWMKFDVVNREGWTGQKLDIKVLGLASIASDVSPELARQAIGSLVVLGALQASPAVKAALADRIL